MCFSSAANLGKLYNNGKITQRNNSFLTKGETENKNEKSSKYRNENGYGGSREFCCYFLFSLHIF